MLSNPGLGRKFAPDERDLNYPMRAVVPGLAFSGFKYWWDSGAWLDQGSTSTCVGHGWAHWVEDSPITPEGTIDPFWIYRECCKVDEWTDNDDGDTDFGTSVRAGAKVLMADGKISSYTWAFDLQTIIDAVGYRGGVVVGTNWYSSMFNTRPVRYDDGTYRQSIIIAPSSYVVGGHCYVLNGVNTDLKFFRVKNSWGRSWGSRGRACIPFQDMERLIQEDGEACMAVQRRGT